MPASVKAVIESLQAGGFEAYAVGGCVRDSILGREPDDWDITTSATPWQVKELFQRTVDTGLQHGTVTVLIGGGAHEVTTYRIDGDYEDGRHPKEVTFTASLEEDLKRRDFTVNAMAYNEQEGLVDPFGGMEDLQRKCIRCVGAAAERFAEDALRILRALRFSAQLGFGIERETYEAVCRMAPSLSRISAERIAVELTKLLLSDRPEYVEELYRTGITSVILPEFDEMMHTEQNSPYHCYTVGRHTSESLKFVPADRILRFTMLLHDVGKPACRTADRDGTDHFKGHAAVGAEMARRILRRLKLDNRTVGQVTTLIQWHDCRMKPEMAAIRRILSRIGPELFGLLLQVQYADTMAKSTYGQQEELERIRQAARCYEAVLERGQCISLRELRLTGSDLMELGMRPGPQIGRLLQEALELVLEEPEKNDAGILRDWAAWRLEENSWD